jgi:ribosomal protein L29
MAAVISLSRHPRHRWHPTRGDHAPQRETSTNHEVAELRAEVAQLRQALASQGSELAELRVQLDVGPSWMSTDEMRAMVADAEAEDDARLKEGA